MILNRRRYMEGKALPYDYEVEYLESTGTDAYIDTGITPTLSYSVEIEFSYVSLDTTTDASGNLFGCINGWAQNMFITILDFRTWKIWNCWGNKTSDITDRTFIEGLVGSWHTLVYKNYKTTIDGVQKGTAASSPTGNPVGSAYLFSAKNYANGNIYGKGQTIKRIRSFKMYDANSNLVMDFIPVRKGTIGYMYDKVSGQLFGNADTGDFILGPDKLPYGYTQLVGIKNTSTAYLPISVPLGTNVRYELESMGTGPHFSWNTTGNKEIIIFFTNNKSCYLNGNFSAPSFSTTSRYKIVIDLGRESEYARAYIDDVLVRETAININSGANVQLFRDANRGNNLKMTIYAFKAYSGESLVNDYIPAMRKSDSKVGVYDIAANEFITSPNGVDFVAVT